MLCFAKLIQCPYWLNGCSADSDTTSRFWFLAAVSSTLFTPNEQAGHSVRIVVPPTWTVDNFEHCTQLFALTIEQVLRLET